MARMPDNFVDVIVTSPPYNIGRSRTNKTKVNGRTKWNKLKYNEYNDNLSVQEYLDKTKKWIDGMLRITKHHIFYNIAEFTGNKGIIKFIYANYGDYIKEVWVWAKTNPQPSLEQGVVRYAHEYIFCFSKDAPGRKKFTHTTSSKSDNLQNIFIKPAHSGIETKGHSFAFPIWLPHYFIHYFTYPDELIYDPFMGLFTTAIAAEKEGRRWIGSEISGEYIRLGKIRLQNHRKQLTLFGEKQKKEIS